MGTLLKKNILFVDDEPSVCDSVEIILSGSGFNVRCCRSGSEALKAFQKTWQETDLVIMDMFMPGISGPETFRAMKQIYRGVKVLFVSGFAAEEEIREVEAEGAKGFIHKPFTIEQLRSGIEKALS